MAPARSSTLSDLLSAAQATCAHAYTPYSGHPIATVFLLSDGSWVPGVRVESASFSLVIPALLNGYTTLVAAQRTDLVAIAQSEPFRSADRHVLSLMQEAQSLKIEEQCAFIDSVRLPEVGAQLSPFLNSSTIASPDAGVALAHRVSQGACIPESNFPVGCVLESRDGNYIPGVNVEFEDWSHILCAERNALGTALSYGLRDFTQLYLSCPTAPGCSPCGACRQLLAEHAPTVSVWMDRVKKPLKPTTPNALLPHSFSGNALTRY